MAFKHASQTSRGVARLTTALARSTALVAPALALASLTAPMAAQAADATDVQAVVVTGSRIKQPNLTTTSPVTSISNIETKLQGAQRTEDLINNLPQAFASGQSSAISNGSTGIATVDLRGQGCSRTLVTVDSRRLMAGDPKTPCSDLNNIPAALIDRVDVLTGGASAIYGSDAMTGVVNFVLKKNFEGLQIDINHSLFQHDNTDSVAQAALTAHGYAPPKKSWSGGNSTDVNLTMGVNSPDGKGNLTAWLGYRSTDPVTQDHFDHAACAMSGTSSYPTLICLGSSTNAFGRIRPQTPVAGKPGVFSNTSVEGTPFAFGLTGDDYKKRYSGNVFDSANPGSVLLWSGAKYGYNFAPFNYFQRNDTRYTAGFNGRYQVNNKLEVYSQLMFMDDTTTAQIAPSGAFYGHVLSTNCDNPLLSYATLGAGNLICPGGPVAGTTGNFLLGRRSVEGGPRQDYLGHTSFRLVFGGRGDLNDTWSYDLYGQYGQTNLNENYQNDMSFSKIQKSLQVDPATGKCVSVINGTDPNCVPWNIFTTGAVTQAALNYLNTPAFQSARDTETVVSGYFSGKLGNYGVKSPWASEGVGLVIGGEYRRESQDFRVDNENATGDLAGSGSPTPSNSGAYSVKEIYTEVRVPVINDRPYIKDLSFNGAYRYSDYTGSAGTASTYSIEGNWTPNSDVRFRASYNRAVRVPNTFELFNPNYVGLSGSSDPCAGSKPTYSLAQCSNDPFFAVAANQSLYGTVDRNPAQQYNGYLGGNTQLKPETGDTVSVGAILTPSFIPGFTATVDWWDITINDVIKGYGTSTVEQNCYEGNIAYFCNLIHRQPGSGSLWLGDGTLNGTGYVGNTLVNSGMSHTRGWDFQANYRLNLDKVGLKDMGRLDFALVGTLLDLYFTQPLPAHLPGVAGDLTNLGTYHCEGLFGPQCNTPNPTWRSSLRTTWSTPWNWTASMRWRYIDQVKLDPTGTRPDLREHIGAISYFDLSGTWRIKENIELHGGINNLLDKDPPYPIQGGASNGNTSPDVYDAMGRYFFIGLTANY
jgi:iron complex outermembrane receptor protein